MNGEGFLLINKPSGMSSYDVIRYLKPIFGKKKMGHSGTLDPFATGLMIIAVGSLYTKQLHKLQGLDKSYRFRMVFGLHTDTLDCDGNVDDQHDTVQVSEQTLREAIQGFVGEQKQIPPAFSAKKKDGKKSYELARQGQTLVLDPVQITIHSFDLLAFNEHRYPMADCDVSCSKGTYIRTLVEDVAKACGSIAYTKDLCRTKIDSVSLENAIELDQINRNNLSECLHHELPISH